LRAAGIEELGGDVRVFDLPERPPAPDEVVIAVRAAGVANWDDFVRRGAWQVGGQLPLALGVEAAGVIEAVGDDVTAFAPGDEVLTHPVPLRHQGAWAERLVAPAALVARKPSAMAWDVAGALPVPALTADQALADVTGGWVLVNGGGGVTGSLLVQLAVERGAAVIATAGPESAERVQDYGAHLVLDYHDPDWPTRARAATPGGLGVAAAVNAAPGGAAGALRAVADGGRLATITGDPPPAEREVTIVDVYVRADGPRLAALAELPLSLPVAATCRLSEAADALRRVTFGRAPGAIVLSP
jgi:NADPH:quinone reductase-like Zn-dependent oxidoreductase